jgi:predicted GNAT family acetyltransferase
MSTHDNQGAVINNEAAHRYEFQSGDQVAVLTYKRSGQHIIFIHTGVPPALEGHGVAGKLAHTALEDARTQGLTVVPQCPFVASYIRRHLEYLSLLSPSDRERLLRDE